MSGMTRSWSVKWEPRDVWVGLYWNRRANGIWVYICPVPCVVIIRNPADPARADRRLPPLGTYEYTDKRVDHAAVIADGERREISVGYTCTLAPEPTRWQRFKAWVSRLLGGRS